MKILLLVAVALGGAVGGWVAHMITQRVVLSRAIDTGLARMDHQEEPPFEEHTVYALSFPDGSPVTPGRFQEWLDMIHDDPEIPEEEYAIAKAIIKRMRARFN